ncbi:hypothetical protein H2248_003301 [Termitomyces sp. 'cryptogamus']|nr:hypothetical protein H2248_003301 [Termitomyces sp. 'cryptogamus']
MYALREQRQHVTQEDFKFTAAKSTMLTSQSTVLTSYILQRSSGRTRKETHRSTKLFSLSPE